MSDLQDANDVYSEYTDNINGIKYYDEIQFFLRKFSLMLLLGTFGAIFFVLSIKVENLYFRPVQITVALSALAVIVNLSLAAYDLIVIERLLMSNYIEALRLESMHEWIFPIHIHMMDYDKKKHHGSTLGKAQFYIEFNTDIVVLSGLIIAFLIGFEHWLQVVLFVLPTTLIVVVLLRWALKSIGLSSEKWFADTCRAEIGGQFV